MSRACDRHGVTWPREHSPRACKDVLDLRVRHPVSARAGLWTPCIVAHLREPIDLPSPAPGAFLRTHATATKGP